MVDTAPEDRMRREMKKLDKLVEEMDTELIFYLIEKSGDELERRSQKEMAYIEKRRRNLNV